MFIIRDKHNKIENSYNLMAMKTLHIQNQRTHREIYSLKCQY